MYADNLSSGLFFQSHSFPGQERTGLTLNNDRSFELPDEATISFDMLVRPEIIFGYVTRIITDTNHNIDLVFSVSEQDVRYPSLVVGDAIFPVTTDNAEVNCWIPVSIRLSQRDKCIGLTYGSIYKMVPYDFKDVQRFRVSFGACNIDIFSSGDAAPVNIKNIKVYEKSRLIRHWMLGKHKADICYDEIEEVPAMVRNPRWLIDDHTKWTKIYSKQLQREPQYAFDSQQGDFYIVPDGKNLIRFNTATLKDTLFRTSGGYPAGNTTNQLLYDSNEGRLVSYNLDDKTVSSFSFVTMGWDQPEQTTTEHRYFNHTSSWVPKDSSIVSFGGYGFYMYNNELTRVNPRTNEWKQVRLPEIDPRYSPSSVVVGNELFIFGGRGCKSGRQDTSPHNYYDLYAVNLETNEARKIVDVTNPEEIGPFLPGCNMVFNSSDSTFYLFTEQGNGSLLCFSLKDPVLRRIALPINEDHSSDILFCSLYYSFGQKKMYALIGRNFKNAPSEVAIYSMSYPPIPARETEQDTRNAISLLGMGLGVIGILFLFVLYLIWKGKKKKHPVKEEAGHVTTSMDMVTGEVADTVNTELSVSTFDRSRSCICLFGSFRVVGKNGDDCTGQFTPVLKSLLLLILLYTDKTGKGIPGTKLDELLWGDKSEKSARNNRNVSISKLRGLLEQVGSIQIVCDNNYWKISIGNDVFCDYQTARDLIRQGNSGDKRDDNFFRKLLELLFYGSLLPNTQADWLDGFKSDYSSDAIDLLNELLVSEEVLNNSKLKLRIADTIFLHDVLNEEALAVKCYILFQEGKKTLARNAYENFCKEYKNLLGIDYAVPFTEILKQA